MQRYDNDRIMFLDNLDVYFQIVQIQQAAHVGAFLDQLQTQFDLFNERLMGSMETVRE
jgi:hypothetical protein